MDTRRDHTSNRRQLVSDVATAQAVAGIRPGDAHINTFEQVEHSLFHWMQVIDEHFVRFSESEEQLITDAINVCAGGDAPDQHRVARSNRLRKRLEEARQAARAVKSICEGLTQAAKERHKVDLDRGPDAIELTGVENMRAQLTQSLDRSKLN